MLVLSSSTALTCHRSTRGSTLRFGARSIETASTAELFVKFVINIRDAIVGYVEKELHLDRMWLDTTAQRFLLPRYFRRENEPAPIQLSNGEMDIGCQVSSRDYVHVSTSASKAPKRAASLWGAIPGSEATQLSSIKAGCRLLLVSGILYSITHSTVPGKVCMVANLWRAFRKDGPKILGRSQG
mgnify:CR=1 FL=1